MPTILIQNGGHQQYEGNVTLKEKTFLITALNSLYVERHVMNKLLKNICNNDSAQISLNFVSRNGTMSYVIATLS